MSLILDGTAGVTFPSGSGTQAAQSKVLQVVSATYNTPVSTSSSTNVTSNLTASITPLFSTSKILIVANIPSTTSTSPNQVCCTFYKGSTNLALTGGSFPAFGQSYGNNSVVQANIGMAYLDSPATTSSTTYTVYFLSSNGGTVSLFQNNMTGTLTIMEIAA